MNKLRLVLVFVVVLASNGCSNQPPLAPGAAPAGASDSSAKPSAAAPGIYTLTFWAHVNGSLQEVTSVPVQTAELILQASVTSIAGTPAQAGTVTFEYCSYKGLPPGDIPRADEAPKEACEQGTATWDRLGSSPINTGPCRALGPGYACLNFGLVRIPRDVGFRFRYVPQRSDIAGGTSQPRNFTWTAGS